MNNVKIAFFDIDGTLIDMNTKIISEKTIYTLQQLKSNGIIICLATGRSPICLPKFDHIEFDAYLTFNGSYCFNKKENIYRNPISREDVEILLKNASEMKRAVSIATSKQLVANGKEQDLEQYYSFANLELEVAEDFDEQAANEEIYQVMLACREEEYSQILKNTKNVKIAAWWDRAIDIIPANGGKGVGVKKILEYYHLKIEEAVAFGDGNNDIEMFEAVGTGIAMGNASDKLKEIATDICGNVSEDGIYHYCVKYDLI